MTDQSDEAARRDEFLQAAQRAAAIVAARKRGEHDDAGMLMRDFPDEQARFLGFYLVAEMALTCLAQATGDSVDDTVRHLNLAMEAGLPRAS